MSIGIAVKRWMPRVPYMIAAMVGGSLVAVALDFLLGAGKAGIATVGALPRQSAAPLRARPDAR